MNHVLQQNPKRIPQTNRLPHWSWAFQSGIIFHWLPAQFLPKATPKEKQLLRNPNLKNGFLFFVLRSWAILVILEGKFQRFFEQIQHILLWLRFGRIAILLLLVQSRWKGALFGLCLFIEEEILLGNLPEDSDEPRPKLVLKSVKCRDHTRLTTVFHSTSKWWVASCFALGARERTNTATWLLNKMYSKCTWELLEQSGEFGVIQRW